MPIARFISDLDELLAEFKHPDPVRATSYDDLRLAVARLDEIARQLDIAYRKIEPLFALAEMEIAHNRVDVSARQKVLNDRFLMHENCLTEHPEIDADHRELMAIGNRVFELACSPHISGTTVHEVLDDFLAHCRRHFAFEESLMVSTAFPLADAHAASHRRMLDYIEEMQSLAEANPLTVAIKMDKFIGSWFTWHMQRDDMALAAHAKEASR